MWVYSGRQARCTQRCVRLGGEPHTEISMLETMPAIVFHGEGKWSLDQLSAPRVSHDDEVLLRVDRAGICGTDLHILHTPPGHPATPGAILGHEYVATLLDAGDGVRGFEKGDRVIVDPNLTCGRCSPCRVGRTNACENMTTLGIFLNGGLAAFNVAPAKALHKIRGDVPVEQAALVEPLTCVLHAFEKAAVQPGESVAIFGAGPIGLLFLLLFRAAGAGSIAVVEPASYRAGKAKECGADEVIDFAGTEAVEAIQSVSGGGVDITVDAVGRCMEPALKAACPGGRVLLFGMDQHSAPTVNQFDISRRELTIFGSFIQQTAFPKVVRLLETGTLPTAQLITHQLPLSEFGQAVELLESGEAVKIVLNPSQA